MVSKMFCAASSNLIRQLQLKSPIRAVRRLSQLHSPSQLSFFHHIGDVPLVHRTIGQELEKAAAEYGSTEAIVSVHENKRHTFHSLIDDVDRLASAFLKLGLERGDRIGIWGPNTIQWYLTMMAAARIGLVGVGINPGFQAPEVDYCLKKVHVKAIVAPERHRYQNYYEILTKICPELASPDTTEIKSEALPFLKRVIIDSENRLPGAINFYELFNLGDATGIAAVRKLQSRIGPDSICNVQFTSGTTGKPKATQLTHNGFVNNGIHVASRNQLAGQRICVQVPLFHAYGAVITIIAGLCSGATLVLPSAGFNPEASLRAIVAEKCTIIHGTPTMYVDLIKKQRELNLPLKTAKRAITGGAPCSPQLFRDIKEVLGLEEVRTVYGLTETTAVVFQSRRGDTTDQILNTVGHVQDHMEVKVVDPEGNMVPFGQVGELYTRSYSNMVGYYGDEEKTKETIGADNWVRTGDQFILNANGYGQIVGRLKELIIRGGENIFPKEIEDFLNTHPEIIESHVIGVPDERMGEEICAFVRLKDGTTSITIDELKAFSKNKFAHFKVPKFVIPVDGFPKTTSGKIQKFKLLDIYKSL